MNQREHKGGEPGVLQSYLEDYLATLVVVVRQLPAAATYLPAWFSAWAAGFGLFSRRNTDWMHQKRWTMNKASEVQTAGDLVVPNNDHE